MPRLMFSHPAALLCNARGRGMRGEARGARVDGGGGWRGPRALSSPAASLFRSFSSPARRRPYDSCIQSRHATMNSTNYVAFSFAALFDRGLPRFRPFASSPFPPPTFAYYCSHRRNEIGSAIQREIAKI